MNKEKTVWLLFSDPVMHSFIAKLLLKIFDNYNKICIESESEFYELLLRSTSPPDILIATVFLPWSKPGVEHYVIKTQEVIDEGFYKAGFRCIKLFGEKFPDTEIVLTSWLDILDVKDDIENIPGLKHYLFSNFVSRPKTFLNLVIKKV